MENLVGSSSIFVNKVLDTFSDLTYLLHGVLFLISAVLLFLLSIVYKNIRKKFPVRVNCWFCNNFTKVAYELANSWDCPHCKQYNGFNQDGGYNKVIKEQYNAKLNDEVFNTLKPTFTSSSSKNKSQSNGFCNSCNINQQLKIQQLALFVPVDENNYFEEIEQYREKLEKAYKLCSMCERTLKETLEKQEYNLLQNRLNSHKKSNLLERNKVVNSIKGKEILLKLQKNGVQGLKWISVIVAVFLFLALVVQFETEHKLLYPSLPHFAIFEPFEEIPKVGLFYMREIHKYSKELSFAGFLCSLLGYFERQIKKAHIVVLVWGLLHILLWSSLTGFQVVMSGVCLLVSTQAGHWRTISLNKKPLLKKSGFQPVKQVFPEVYNLRAEEFSSFLQQEPQKPVSTEKKKSQGTNTEDMKPKRKKKKENEAEVVTSESVEPINPEPQVVDPAPGLKGSAFRKDFLSSLEVETEGNDSFGDVFNDLNGLRLGEKSKKSSKTSNFLFTNHNFAEGKASSSIIKPAKFIKNLSGSWTCESNECGSRSSTPSSGYSSQKPDKMEPNRYDFSKTMTPISINPFGRHSPPECFDYYGGNNGFYNNFNYCSPGFVPFQHGPMGHTTIYTCTRPTNFPFPFPWQGFPPQKFSPTSRFSDASDCDNLFQNASKSFEKSRRWFKLKTFSYYLSIFLNFFTFLALIYFISTGIISVDWKLPRLNFYI